MKYYILKQDPAFTVAVTVETSFKRQATFAQTSIFRTFKQKNTSGSATGSLLSILYQMGKQQNLPMFVLVFSHWSAPVEQLVSLLQGKQTIFLLLTVCGVVWCVLVRRVCGYGTVRSLPRCWIWWSGVNTFLGALRKSASVRRGGSESRNACFRYSGLRTQSHAWAALRITWACFILPPDRGLTGTSCLSCLRTWEMIHRKKKILSLECPGCFFSIV